MDKIIEKYSVKENTKDGGYDVEIKTKFPIQSVKILDSFERGKLSLSCVYNDQEYKENIDVSDNFSNKDYKISTSIFGVDLTISIRPKMRIVGHGFLKEFGLSYDRVEL